MNQVNVTTMSFPSPEPRATFTLSNGTMVVLTAQEIEELRRLIGAHSPQPAIAWPPFAPAMPSVPSPFEPPFTVTCGDAT